MRVSFILSAVSAFGLLARAAPLPGGGSSTGCHSHGGILNCLDVDAPINAPIHLRARGHGIGNDAKVDAPVNAPIFVARSHGGILNDAKINLPINAPINLKRSHHYHGDLLDNIGNDAKIDTPINAPISLRSYSDDDFSNNEIITPVIAPIAAPVYVKRDNVGTLNDNETNAPIEAPAAVIVKRGGGSSGCHSHGGILNCLDVDAPINIPITTHHK